MAPTLVASYDLVTSAVDTSTLTTASFTPGAGEVIVVKAATWDASQPMGTPSGGGLTYTSRAASTSGGFRPWVGIWTAVVSGSPGAMTVSCTPTVSSWHNMVVERWSGAQLAATPVTDAAQGGTGSASSSLTTSAADSVISWVAGDAQSLNPATRTYLSSGTVTEELVDDQHASTNGVWYYARQTVASAGSTAYGLSAPTGMQWWIAGIEILNVAGGTTQTAAAALSVTATLAAAATASKPAPAGLAATASLSTSAAATKPAAAAVSVAATLTASAAAASLSAGTAIAVSATLSAAATRARSTDAALPATATTSVAAALAKRAAAALAATATLTAAAVTGTPPKTADAALAIAVTIAAVTARAALTAASVAATATLSAAAPMTQQVATALAVLAEMTASVSAQGSVTTRPFTGTTSRPDGGRTSRPFAGVTPRP